MHVCKSFFPLLYSALGDKFFDSTIYFTWNSFDFSFVYDTLEKPQRDLSNHHYAQKRQELQSMITIGSTANKRGKWGEWIKGKEISYEMSFFVLHGKTMLEKFISWKNFWREFPFTRQKAKMSFEVVEWVCIVYFLNCFKMFH